MKVSNGKKAAVAVGVSAVLALTPVAGPIGIALADDPGAMSQEARAGQIDVTFQTSNGPITVVADANGHVDFEYLKAEIPDFDNVTGFSWTDANGAWHGFGIDMLANYEFTETCTVMVEYAEQGGETEEPEQPASQINVTFKYDNASVATVADENGNIDADALGLPDNYTWSWTDDQGTVHEFGSDQLATYIFTESCTVTGTANKQPEQPASQIDVTFKYDNTSVATTADENGRVNAADLGLPMNYTWSWTDKGGTVHEFGSDLLAGYVFTEDCTVYGSPAESTEPEQPASQIDVTFKYDNTSVATVADENGKINPEALGLPDNYTWSWTDAQGTVHEFDSDLLATYIFTESCTVTGAANQQPEQPVSQIDVTFKYDNTTIATTADANGRIPAGIAAKLPSNYTWTWTDAQGAVHEFGSDLLAGYIFTESCTVTGTPAEEPVVPSEQINVTFKYGNETLATVAGEDGTISADVVAQLPSSGIAAWSWTDKGGTVHEFAPSMLAGYIFTESCTVTAIPVEQSADQIDVTFKWNGGTLATVADENGLISAAAIEQLPGDVAYWTWTDAQGTVHEFAPSLLPNYIFTESCIVNAVLNDQPADPYITVNYWDGDTLLGTGAVLNGTSDWSGIVGPTKDGYTFLGWQFEGDDAIYTDAELDNVIYAADETVTEINLYAQWQENAVDPGTDPDDPDNPGTVIPDPEQPGTDPEQPGTNPEQPGSGEEGQGGEQGGATSEEQVGTDDNATDEVTPLETAKADEGTNDMPATGDSTLPVAGGIAALAGASAIAAAAAARKRHSDR